MTNDGDMDGRTSDVFVGDLLQVANLTVHYPVRENALFQRTHQYVHAVDDVSFGLNSGQTIGLVGESGCGKSTTARAVLQLVKPTSGSVRFFDQELTRLGRRQMRRLRRDMQMIFQDTHSSLNGRMTVRQLIGEALSVHDILPRGERDARVAELLATVGLDPRHADRYPHEFSGGQRQRIGVARALAVEPKLIVCDEPISALDVSVRAQVINLLEELQESRGIAYLFIAHDISVVRHLSDRIAVMYLGKIVEMASDDGFYSSPLHPYSQALLSAVPVPDPDVERRRERIVLSGDVPTPVNPPRGCRFEPRCPFAQAVCREEPPELVECLPGRSVACHFWREIAEDPLRAASRADDRGTSVASGASA